MKTSLVGESTAGGVIMGPGAPDWTVEEKPISLVGDSVAGHGNGPHQGPTMVQGSTWMTIDGIPVVVETCLASCGHQATGNPWMNVPK